MPDAGETDYQSGTGDYTLTSTRESTGEAALVVKMRRQQAWERCIAHTNDSVRSANADAILVCGASADEDEAHKEQRRKEVERLREMKRGAESMTDAQYKEYTERIAGPDAMMPVPETARQDAIRYYDSEIAKLQNGAPVYTTMDNVKGFFGAPVRAVKGLWGMVEGAGNTVVDLGKGAAAGELMQSSDPALRAEGERLAKESGENLYNRGKSVVTGIFQIIPNMAKQASAGNWGEPLGDMAMIALTDGVAKGLKGKAATVGEPVSVATGEYLETWRDFLVPGTFVLDGARYMGLQLGLPAGYVSPLGPCQISMFDEIFANPDHGVLAFHDVEGRQIWFDRPFNFLPSTNKAHPNLALKAPWLKQLTLKDGRVTKHFKQYPDKIYRLEKIDELNGFELVLHRSDEGWLERVDGPDGLSLSFANDSAGRRLSIELLGTDGTKLELARYAYDERGRMISADCAYGMSVRYAWQPTEDLLSSWHNITRQSEAHFTYDDAGRVVATKTNGIWNGDRFEYGDGETRYLPGGSAQTAQIFAYDESQNITAETDALGGTTLYRYDQAGFRIATKDANGNESRTRYDSHGHVHEDTDAEGRVTTYIWGDDSELHLVIDGAGNRTTYAHDTRSNVVSETDAEGNVTRLQRDGLGHIVETRFPNGAVERRTWNRYNRLESVTDAKGNTTRLEYDAFNRVIATIAPNGDVTRQAYQSGAGGFDTASAVTRPDGVRASRSFDGSGQLATVCDGEGRTWTYRYGAFGVLEAITDPKGGVLKLSTDIEGRVISVTNATGRVYAFERDAAGRVVLEEDFDGRVRRYTRDAAGQVTEMAKPDGANLRYAYDKSGLLRRIESFDAKGNAEDVTRFWYDGRALLIRAENKAALIEYWRDRNGRIVSETQNGRRIRSKLDAMGNRMLREIVGPGQMLTEYVRDPLGLVEKLISGEAEFSFSHDSLGRETGRRMGGFHLQQRFDSVSQLMAQVAGPQSQSGLDVSRLGWNVPDALSERSATRASHTRPGQVRRTYEYDRAFAPVTIDDNLWGPRRLTHDDNGQLTDSEAGFGSERFRYDEARNLAGASSSIEYAPDAPTPYGKAFDEAFGSVIPAGAPQVWNTTAGGVVQIARGPKGERIQLTHDECGRLVERRVERDGFRPERWRYRWDAYDRLVGVKTLDGEEWLFRYDPFGRRVSKVRRLSGEEKERAARLFPSLVGTDGIPADARPFGSQDEQAESGIGNALPMVGTAYLWDGDHMVAEAPLRLDGHVASDMATHWHFEEGTHRLLGRQTASGEMLAVVCDHLGTPKEMFDRRGDLVWAVDHHVWGAVRSERTYGTLALAPKYEKPSAVSLCPWRFPGQYEDVETGLYYNRQRHYDPLAGQYASPDPIGLLGGDRPQGYVDNPQIWTDPLGLSALAARVAETARIRSAVDQAVGELAQNPGMARQLMSPGSYNHLVVRDGLAAASYGKAVERRAAQILRNDPTLQHTGMSRGPNGQFIQSPDFVGAGGTYDITTQAGLPSHLARPYGPTTTHIIHPGLPTNTVFPR
ncbi:RHS repeat-associated core domain-containing protein [Rhizobium sp. P44RR-XXIV]|uniref:RHS repeat-associated core domain-containing protein n=1 Tax=Rhizobium sp. P44RR-XXIV TaxID=1921145 RepID=UPI000985A1F1|nr:RHS repeat-associated core domain-containing protein [Rhizobium sp. P44RR-XXIV]TIX90814.1 RHS repeat protein [Rhizobium sp. P44RR-XXIV]